MSTIEKALQKNKSLEANKKKADIVSAPTNQNDAAIVNASTKQLTEEPPQSKTDGELHKKQVFSLERLKDIYVTNTGRKTINEEFRAIKRKVLSTAFGPLSKTLKNSNIIMVSSAKPNEGKTYTAINLALSIAFEQDKTVLLVDADVLRPSIMKIIDQPFDKGLMEYLLGEVDDLSEVICPTSLSTLRIIPAGKSHLLSTELLASEKMQQTMTEFSNRYPDRIVILDCPPLLGINETAILANLAGQAIIVVQEGKTNLADVSRAVEYLNPEMSKGFVVNKAQLNSGEGSGYHGYYYGPDDV